MLKKKIIVILLFIFFYFIFLSNALINYYFISSDGMNIASFLVAKYAGIENFKKDFILNNPKLYNWYTPGYLKILFFLWKIFGENMYLAFWSQLLLIIGLFFAGIYFLGKKILKNNYWEILFILTLFTFVKFPFGGGWGIPFKSPRPQIFFISLVPLMFYYFICIIENSKNNYLEYIFPFFIGLTIHIHPVSAPYFIVTFFLCYIYILYKKKNNYAYIAKKALVYIFITTIAVLPYLIVYIKKYLNTLEQNADFNLYMKAAMMRYNKYTFNLKGLVFRIYKDMPIQIKFMFIFSLIFSFINYIKKRNNILNNIIYLFFITLFIFSLLIPYIDYTVSFRCKKIPFQVDFPRNLIFLVFLIELMFFINLSDFIKIVKTKYIRAIFNIFAFLLVISLFYNNFINAKKNFIIKRILCNKEINIFKRYNSIREKSLIINYVMKKGESIFPFYISTNTTFPRALNLKSVSYSYKDGGVILYSGYENYIKKWYYLTKLLKNVNKKSKNILKKKKYSFDLENKILQTARENESDYILFNSECPLLLNGKDFILSNNSILIKTNNKISIDKIYSKAEKVKINRQKNEIILNNIIGNEQIYFIKFKLIINSKNKYTLTRLMLWNTENIDGKINEFYNTVLIRPFEEIEIKAIIYISEDFIRKKIKVKLVMDGINAIIKNLKVFKVDI